MWKYIIEQKPWFFRRTGLIVYLVILFILWAIGFYSSWELYHRPQELEHENWDRLFLPLWQAPLYAAAIWGMATGYTLILLIRRFLYGSFDQRL